MRDQAAVSGERGRVRGLAWCLSILWAGLGAAGACYDLILSAHVPVAAQMGIPQWVGEPGVIVAAAYAGALAWLLLTIPVLPAGLVRFRRSRLRAGAPGGWGGVGLAWAGLWIAGIALMFPVAGGQPFAPPVLSCSKNQWCEVTGYSHAVVGWAELAVLAGWLALAMAMTVILAWSARGRDPSGTSRGRSGDDERAGRRGGPVEGRPDFA